MKNVGKIMEIKLRTEVGGLSLIFASAKINQGDLKE